MPTKKFPTLFGRASNGKVKVWSIWAESLKTGAAMIYTEHGYEDGERQTAAVRVDEGKNLGTKRETTPFEQACSEAESKWNKKRDKKYFLERADALDKRSGPPLPMLAHDFKKRGHDIKWPAYIQPKLNGIRCLATKIGHNEVRYGSRGGKDFTTLEHLTPHLQKVMRIGDVFDGELFTRRLTFQQITSAVKRQQDDTTLVEYWVYDVVREIPFNDRFNYLRDAGLEAPIILVPTLTAESEDQMKKLHRQMMDAEYEGTIIRNIYGTYRANHRSPNLQKYKDFVDEEFVIVGGKQGIGKDEGAVTFLCETEEGKRFDCRPRGTYEQRKKWWAELRQLMGKKLTVRYQTLSDTGIPIFPVGISIRDYE